MLLEPARPYHPQAGDVFLCTDHLLIARLGHFIAGADSPHHSGLIFLKPNGQAAMLEGGPHNTLRVRVLDMEANLKAYEGLGDTIWIRRRAKPLTPEQSKKLTDFSLAQDGKQFAWGRLLGQLTPFRSRGPWRTQYIGGPHGERTSYFCSELVTESLVACGALTAERTRPAATYPCDLFLGQSPIPFINDNLDINKTWDPPARWFSKLPLKAAN